MHSTPIVYTWPLPFPERSALSATDKSPLITQSGSVLPSPALLADPLLATEMISQLGAGSQLSYAETAMVTDTILWFGGHRTCGLAERFISGGVSSLTVIVT
ncbi:MAG: hypothetical protein GTO18_17215 [Anaerolineales bacterium]|nr:hypothetical protein [Anaerolineales bacterium]